MRRRSINRYTVKAGDSLWSISERFYGDGEHWDSIHAENIFLIGSDPDYLIEGITLKISSRPLRYVQIIEEMISYYDVAVYQAQAMREESPEEAGLLFKYQDILFRIRVMQGFVIVMLLLLLFAAFG